MIVSLNPDCCSARHARSRVTASIAGDKLLDRGGIIPVTKDVIIAGHLAHHTRVLRERYL